MKKILTVSTLVGLGLIAVMLIASILGLSFFKGTRFDILLIVATLTVGGYFAIGSSEIIKKKKVLGSITSVLIGVSALLVIATVLFKTGDTFDKFTFSFAALSVLFNFIVSTKLKLGNKQLLPQIASYAVWSITIVLTLVIYLTKVKFDDISTVYLILLVLTLISTIVISVLANKSNNFEVEEMVKISKTEYLELKEKAKKYDEMTKK